MLRLISNPDRIKILTLITVREWDVKSLSRELAIEQPAMSQHLSVLREAQLVSTRRSGQHIFYFSDSPTLLAILNTLGSLDVLSVPKLCELA
ncbi:ArsR/SmtB family transcription factor [Agrobacterium rosae]|uniref:ArsR/SmtB family transcription factor n=1 Tax=Agrobacterium rosae TaxID=1972867 RepID=UPI00387B8CB0